MSLIENSGSVYTPIPATCQYWKRENWVPRTYPTFSRIWDISYLERSFQGWKHPGFHKRVRKGELLGHTPWTQYESAGHTTGGWGGQSQSGSATADYWGTPHCSNASWKLSASDLVDYSPEEPHWLVQEAAAKIYNEGHDTLTFLAELLQVKRMFADTAKRLLTLDIPKSWKRVNADWLSYRYGWRPLIGDIKNLNEAITKLKKETVRRYSKRAKSVSSFTRSRKWIGQPISELIGIYTEDCTVVDEVTVSLRGSVTADVEVAALQFNPLQTGWELIPYSFVVDWFVSVGKTLSAISFLSLQSNYVASCGYRVDVRRTFRMIPIKVSSAFNHVNGTWQDGESTASLEVRVPCSVPLTPHLTFRVDSLKVLDLIALVTGKYRRK